MIWRDLTERRGVMVWSYDINGRYDMEGCYDIE